MFTVVFDLQCCQVSTLYITNWSYYFFVKCFLTTVDLNHIFPLDPKIFVYFLSGRFSLSLLPEFCTGTFGDPQSFVFLLFGNLPRVSNVYPYWTLVWPPHTPGRGDNLKLTPVPVRVFPKTRPFLCLVSFPPSVLFDDLSWRLVSIRSRLFLVQYCPRLVLSPFPPKYFFSRTICAEHQTRRNLQLYPLVSVPPTFYTVSSPFRCSRLTEFTSRTQSSVSSTPSSVRPRYSRPDGS